MDSQFGEQQERRRLAAAAKAKGMSKDELKAEIEKRRCVREKIQKKLDKLGFDALHEAEMAELRAKSASDQAASMSDADKARLDDLQKKAEASKTMLSLMSALLKDINQYAYAIRTMSASPQQESQAKSTANSDGEEMGAPIVDSPTCFQCAICDCVRGTRVAMRSHVRRSHEALQTPDKFFAEVSHCQASTCPHCARTLTSAAGMGAHIRAKHNGAQTRVKTQGSMHVRDFLAMQHRGASKSPVVAAPTPDPYIIPVPLRRPQTQQQPTPTPQQQPTPTSTPQQQPTPPPKPQQQPAPPPKPQQQQQQPTPANSAASTSSVASTSRLPANLPQGVGTKRKLKGAFEAYGTNVMRTYKSAFYEDNIEQTDDGNEVVVNLDKFGSVRMTQDRFLAFCATCNSMLKDNSDSFAAVARRRRLNQ